MIKKLNVAVLVLLLVSLSATGMAFAYEGDGQNYIKVRIAQEIEAESSGKNILHRNYDEVISSYMKYGSFSKEIVDVRATLRNYTGKGSFDVAIVSYTRSGVKHLDIFSYSRGRVEKVFSGTGTVVKLDATSFTLGNIGNDGRYYLEAYTYTWRSEKFLRSGYSKTYIKSLEDFFYDYSSGYHFGIPHRPDIRPGYMEEDKRVKVARSLFNARMSGRGAQEFLSKEFIERLGAKGVYSLIPYGRLTTVDIFNSQRGDWVVAIIKDLRGVDRVLKLVPIVEGDSIKIDDIVEIPKAN